MRDQVVDGADLGHHAGRLVRSVADDDLYGNLDGEAVPGDDRKLVKAGTFLVVPVNGFISVLIPAYF
jgi:hypothetical protein